VPQITPHKRLERLSQRRLNQAGAVRFILVFVLLIGGVFVFRSVKSHALSQGTKLTSGISGTCADDYHDNTLAGAVVDAAHCNNTSSQNWDITTTSIEHDSTRCLSIQNDSTQIGTAVVLNPCDASPGQVWLRDKNGYQNPGSGLCLNAPSDSTGVQLTIASCGTQPSANETWTPTAASGSSLQPSSCNGTEGEKVACYAAKEWNAWQSGTPSHEALLTQYTDGAPYEEWCADFVSYVYKEAGYPFTQGETNGWDENIAGNVQNMGVFTMHPASSYIPKPGDIAYFDYSGGHVEIVVSGGKNPTFVYGNSDTIDPSTGNGDMEANTITTEGSAGQVEYYLTPTGS
jgi:hypothetical protein